MAEKRSAYKLEEMQVEEISAVDSPASPGAKMEFWKRDFSAEERDKLAEEGKALPDGSYPIVNVTDLRNAIQAFGRADNKSEVADHIARRARALGATDELPEDGKLAEMIGKSTKENNMSSELPEEVEKRITALEAVAKAGPAEARYMADKELDLDTKVEFMGKSDEDRMATLKSEGYVDQEDVEKSDLPEDVKKRFDDLEKRAEEAEKIAKAEREKREFDNLKKRAETEYPNLPKDAETKAKVLKAIESADEEVAKAAKEILDGANEAYGSVFKERGVTGSDDEETATAQLNKKAQEKAEAEGVDFAKAYADVLSTPEGEKLYNKSLEEG